MPNRGHSNHILCQLLRPNQTDWEATSGHARGKHGLFWSELARMDPRHVWLTPRPLSASRSLGNRCFPQRHQQTLRNLRRATTGLEQHPHGQAPTTIDHQDGVLSNGERPGPSHLGALVDSCCGSAERNSSTIPPDPFREPASAGRPNSGTLRTAGGIASP